MGGGENYFSNPGEGQNNSQPVDNSDGFRQESQSAKPTDIINQASLDSILALGSLDRGAPQAQRMEAMKKAQDAYREISFDSDKRNALDQLLNTMPKETAAKIRQGLSSQSEVIMYYENQRKASGSHQPSSRQLEGQAQAQKPLLGNVQQAQFDYSNQPQNRPQEVKTPQPVNKPQEQQFPTGYRPGSRGEFVPEKLDPRREGRAKSDGVNTNPYPPFYGDIRTQPTFTDTPGDPRLVNGGHYQPVPVFDARGREIPANQQVRDANGQISWAPKVWRPETGLIPNAQVPPPGRYMRDKYGNAQTPIPDAGHNQNSGRTQDGYISKQAPSDRTGVLINVAQPNEEIPVINSQNETVRMLGKHPNPFTQEELAAAHRNGLKEEIINGKIVAFRDVSGQSEVSRPQPAQDNYSNQQNYQDSRNYQDPRNYYYNRPHGIGQTINNLGNNLYGARRTLNQGRNLIRQFTGGRGFRF